MIGVYCDGNGVRLRRDLSDPKVLPGEEVLTVRCAGICDTDLQIAHGYMGFQGILGHEFVGVTDTGKRVTAEINNACGRCETCRAGRRNHCPHRTVLGILRHNGAMAERVAVPSVNLHEIPDSLDDMQAAFIEPLAAALRILEQVEVGVQDRATVVGDGKLGLLCAWALRETGARVIWVGKYSEKLALGGDGVETRLLHEVDDLRQANDIVVDATGSASGLAVALDLARPCGTVVLKTTVAGRYDINLASIVINEVRVVGSRCGPFDKAISALVSGRFDVRRLVGATFRLADAEEAFRAAAISGARKILLSM